MYQGKGLAEKSPPSSYSISGNEVSQRADEEFQRGCVCWNHAPTDTIFSFFKLGPFAINKHTQTRLFLLHRTTNHMTWESQKTFLLFLIFIIFGGGNITLKCVGRESALKIRKLMFQLFEPYTPSIPDEHKRVTRHMNLTLNRQLSVIYWRSFRFVFSAFWKRNWALYWNACLKPTKQNKKDSPPQKPSHAQLLLVFPTLETKKAAKIYVGNNCMEPWMDIGPYDSREVLEI